MPDGRSVEATGKTVEDAIAAGLSRLSLQRDQVDIQVVHEGSRGILGIGAEPALVRLTERPLLEPAPIAVESDMRPPGEMAAREDQTAVSAAEPSQDGVEAAAREVLEQLLREMGVPGRVSVRTTEESAEGEEGPSLLLDITGPDLGLLIGRRGETLTALQYITRIMVSRRTGNWLPVTVDVEGYKQRRERSLRELALRMAQRAQSEGRPVTLEPMPANERRIVHLALRDHPAVTTLSVGEGESRKVTIRPKS